MDYKDFNFNSLSKAIKDRDNRYLGRTLPEFINIISSKLMELYKCSKEEALEHTISPFYKVQKALDDGKLNSKKAFYSYYLTAAKNSYLTEVGKAKRYKVCEHAHAFLPDNREKLEEIYHRRHFLSVAKNFLTGKEKEVFDAYLDNPNFNSEALAKRFNTKPVNIRIAKHRAIQTLKEVVERYYLYNHKDQDSLYF